MKFATISFLALAWSQSFLSASCELYVTEESGGMVSMVDVKTNAVHRMKGFDHPRVIVIGSSGLAYIGTNDGIWVFDPVTNQFVHNIPLSEKPRALAISPDEKYLALLSREDSLSILQLDDSALVKTISSADGRFSNSQDVQFTRDGQAVFISNGGNNSISVLRTADWVLEEVITGFSAPFGLTMTPNGQFCYVCNKASGTVSILRLSDRLIEGEISGFDAPRYSTCSADGSFLCVSNHGSNEVFLIHTADNSILAKFPVVQPNSVAITADNQYIYSSSGNTSLVKINTTTFEQTPMCVFANPTNLVVNTVMCTETCENVHVHTKRCFSRPFSFYRQVSWKEATVEPKEYQVYSDPELTHLIKTVEGNENCFNDTCGSRHTPYSYYVIAVYDSGLSVHVGCAKGP